MATTAEFGRGKTIFVLAIVIGCFAVLWPKIFYPMLTASISPTNGDPVPAVVTPPPRFRKGASTSQCCDVISVKDTNAHKVMNEICTNIMKKEQMMQQQQQAQQPKYKKAPAVKVSATTLCRNEILQTCGVDITGLLKEDHSITPEYKKSLGQLRTFNTSLCIKMNYGVDFREIGLPRKIKGLGEVYSTLRQERPFRPGPDMVHPALRERGRAIPTVSIPRRTIEREARPGPVPGMRPPVGGAGHIPTGPKGGGTMGIIMPMYTIGIVCFFLYTIMKILFKKPPEAEQAKPAPQVKDYGMDPEHRKYVFSEEYTEGSERSLREPYNKEDRELGIRRRPSAGKSARFYEDRRRLDEGTEIPPTSPAPPPTPATSSEPPLFPVPTVKSEVSSLLPQPQVERKDDDEANKESVVTAVKGIVEAFDATKTSPQSKAASPPPATKKEGKAAPEEDIEKLIASAEKPSTAATKEDLGAAATPSKTTEAQPPSSPTSVVKPALKDKREKSIEKEVKFKLPPEEMEVEEEEEIEEEEEVEIVRPPTPPKTLSKAKPKSSAVAAIAQAKAGMSSPTPTSGVSVIGIEETASLISGERWDMNRTPTPTFRQPTPPVPHRPPSPPDQIPSIYLEGPMPTRGQEFVVREAHVEVEGGDDYDYDDDYEPSGPVILSGKVTLSVISSAAGTALSHEDVTDAPSLSLDDRAQAERSRGKSPAGGKSATLDNASAKNQTGRGKSEVKKSSNVSSPDMDEYEVIGKGGFEHEDDDSADVSLDDFLTATDAEQEGEKAQEDTAADISTMDDLKQEALPKDEE